MLSDSGSTTTATRWTPRLNAPYGARCFLSRRAAHDGCAGGPVLMRLMVLGGF